jgi:Right handed beta helix region
MNGRHPVRPGERQVPLGEALLGVLLRAASRPLARRSTRRAARPRAAVLPAGAARAAVREVAAVALAVALAAVVAVHTQPAMGLQAPPVPASEQVCGSAVLNGGPSSAPPGAVTVAAGDNSAVNFYVANTTFWFASGTHTLGTGLYSQIHAAPGSTYIGAPGAVIDGQGDNHFAFVGNPGDDPVTIEYLTIQDFTPPGAQGAVNANGIQDWTIKYTTIQDNLPGGGMMLGTNSLIESDCLTQNGEYGFNGYSINDPSPVTGGPSNVVMTGNEISYNDTCNWENVSNFPITPPAGCTGAGQYSGCGCSGAGKFWENDGDTITDNYVLGNYSDGMWADTNNAGFNFTGNYFADNYAIALEYEISYNGLIQGNIFAGNAIGVGPTNPGFPEPAVYLSESGSDPRVATAYGTGFQITGNQFYNNWGGVVEYENANRYCTSVGNSSTGACTLVNPPVANLRTCSSVPFTMPPSMPAPKTIPPSRKSRGTGGGAQWQNFSLLIDTTPYIDDCRWKTQNVTVSGNLFDFNPSDVSPLCTASYFCGFNGLFSEFGTIFPFSGANATLVENHVTFDQGNEFTQNTYCGPWGFDALSQGNQYNWATWTSSPYNQDAGSTLNGPGCGFTATPQQGMRNRPVTIPVRTGRR